MLIVKVEALQTLYGAIDSSLHIFKSLRKSLDIKSSSNISNPFDTNIGSPQGDSLSGCLFIIYLEKALCTLRDQVDNNHVTDEHSYAVSSKITLPGECIYADDTDLINDYAEKKKRQLHLVSPTFAEFNLQINDTKTEHTVLERCEKKDEEWCSTKMLDSLIDDQEDILRGKQPSTTNVHNLNSIWIKKNRIGEHIRLNLYKTIVQPVLMYNSQIWDLTVLDENNLDSFHHQHLRTVLYI